MKRIGHIITFFVLVILLLVNGTSREFIHVFSGHQDTVDCMHTHSIADHHAAFEPEHHHCDFLQFATSIFDFAPATFQVSLIPAVHPDFPEAAYRIYFGEHLTAASRGPPEC